MKDRIIRLAAKIYAANIVSVSTECGAYSELLTEEEFNVFRDELDRISQRIHESTKVIATIDDCIIEAQTKGGNP